MPPKKRKTSRGPLPNRLRRGVSPSRPAVPTTTLPTTTALYTACVADTRDDSRRAVLQAVERGYVSAVVWPFLRQHVPAPEAGSHPTLEWFHACHLLAVLLTAADAHQDSSGGVWEFVRDDVVDGGLHAHTDTTSEPTTTSSSMTTWHRVLDTLCHSERTDWEFLTLVNHLLTMSLTGGLGSTDNGADTVGASCLPHVTGLALWHWMPERRRDLEIRRENWSQVWDDCPKPARVPYIVRMLQHVAHLCQSGVLPTNRAAPPPTPDESDDDNNNNNNNNNTDQPEDALRLDEWIFLHRALELLCELLSSVATRVHLVTYLDAIHFTIQSREALGTSRHSRAEENLFLAQQLLERVDALMHFPILGREPVSRTTWMGMYHTRATMLQKMAHRYYADQLPDLIFAGVGLVCGGNSFLRTVLGGLADRDVLELLHKLRLVDKNSGGSENYRRSFLIQILEDYVTVPSDPLDELKSYPLYPTEAVLWDFSQIPPSNASLLPVSNVLTLPKLTTHFLSFTDYLWRNFTLARLESAYEIRADLVDVVRRLRPLLRQGMDDEDEAPVQQTEFSGWARMALELDGQLRITKVAQPLLGERHPSLVSAEIAIDLGPCGDAIRKEWDELGEFDNLFLLTIDASCMTGQAAPLMKDFHLNHGSHHRWTSDSDRPIPDEDDRTFPSRYGIQAVRGCLILQVRDGEGNTISDAGSPQPKGTKRIFRIALDPTQYSMDAKADKGTDLYRTLNLVVRRHGRENNFKSVLETIRGLMVGSGSIHRVIPPWLQPLLLGQGNPSDASFTSSIVKEYALKTVGVANPGDALDFCDTFLDADHLRQSFPNTTVTVEVDVEDTSRKNFKVQLSEKTGSSAVKASAYRFFQHVKGNPVRFTPRQVEAIRSGLSSGLTMVVGPPGTGKTDVAVQIIASLYHSFPTQRTVVITHSNAALNDIFQKVMQRGDVDERYLLRLGSGERDLETESSHDFTKVGRVAYSFARRGQLLEQVQLLSESLGCSGKAERGADGSPSYTCESAEYFNQYQVQRRIRAFRHEIANEKINSSAIFPFKTYFGLGEGELIDVDAAMRFFSTLDEIFAELQEYRPLELLRSQRKRADYIIMKQARVVAMTCTHAAIARSHLLQLGFEYDNVVVEEAGQMTEIETFIPLLLQKGETDKKISGSSRLKRICLMGDHNQLPPVVKNMSFARYSNLDQSFFSRMIRLGAPYIQLNMQGRARPEIANLYSWRYRNLGNLEHVQTQQRFSVGNAGLAHTFQLINVEDFEGKGETSPTAHFYQNVGEAEYAVAIFQYMVLIGYLPQRISILATYNGQKALISDILSQRCGAGTPLAGIRPKTVSTVDQYQGQQNDFVILSLVRTQSVGHLRDIRRLIVAVSRARLGLYIVCRQSVFVNCHELKPAMDVLVSRPTKLQLVLGEHAPTTRKIGDDIPSDQLFEVEDVSHLGSMVHGLQEQLLEKS
jgi:intron-binding protein aquarius